MGRTMLAVAVLETTSVIRVDRPQVMTRMANFGSDCSTVRCWPIHLDRPDILAASDSAKPLPGSLIHDSNLVPSCCV